MRLLPYLACTLAPDLKTDIAIIGGGIAGLWVLNLLRARGVDCMLFERDALGSGQTIASQGMIHGGMKYTLAGATTAASETIASMPDRWRACIDGAGDIDLRGVNLLSDAYYMFTDGSATSNLTAFFASKALRGRINKMGGPDLPPFFQHAGFNGSLYKLNDIVLDTPSLLANLAAPHGANIHLGEISIDDSRTLHTSIGTVQANTIILTAGDGNESLTKSLQVPVSMQRRPLNQVIIRGKLPAVFAHAVSLQSADKPMVTITSHPEGDANAWYLGGALAEETGRTDAAQVDAARELMARLFPWIDWPSMRFDTFRIDRAEPARSEGLRPDTPFVRRHENVLVCWPTKLTLTPLLGDYVLRELDLEDKSVQARDQGENLAPVSIAEAPWSS